MRNIPRMQSTIAWSWTVDDSTGHVIAYRRPGKSPVVVLHFSPSGQEEVFDLSMSPFDALALAEQIKYVGEAARRAEFTPDVLTHVADTYLYGVDDEEILDELVKLADYIGHSPLQVDGTLNASADRVLRAKLNLTEPT